MSLENKDDTTGTSCLLGQRVTDFLAVHLRSNRKVAVSRSTGSRLGLQPRVARVRVALPWVWEVGRGYRTPGSAAAVTLTTCLSFLFPIPKSSVQLSPHHLPSMVKDTDQDRARNLRSLQTAGLWMGPPQGFSSDPGVGRVGADIPQRSLRIRCGRHFGGFGTALKTCETSLSAPN